MVFKGVSSVIGHSEVLCGGCVWYWCVIECDVGDVPVFLCVASDKCRGGLGWGNC